MTSLHYEKTASNRCDSADCGVSDLATLLVVFSTF